MKISRKHTAVCVFLFLACATAIIVGLAIGIQRLNEKAEKHITVNDEIFENGQRQFEYWGELGHGTLYKEFSHAAVSVDGSPCAQVSKEILMKNGSAADAAIAGLFCLGIVNAQSMGIGGGFLLVYYDHGSGKAYSLDARETAPANASQNMFKGKAHLAQKGGLAVAIPGEVHGYFALHQRFGRLHWSQLLEPAIKLCEDGYKVNAHMAKHLKELEDAISKEPTMSEFVNPKTNAVWEEGDIMKRLALAESLRILQDEPDSLYSGILAPLLVHDIQEKGGIVSIEDLKNYKAKWRDPVTVSLENGGFTLYSVPPPGSGLILGFILNILDSLKLNLESLNYSNKIKTNQYIAEAMKYAYARRTELADMDFVPNTELLRNMTSDKYSDYIKTLIDINNTFQDYQHYGGVFYSPSDAGTSHLSIIAPNGDAVSVTSTINYYFGAGFMSPQTGVILNNEMDDFSAPGIINYFGVKPSPSNFIKPGKRPLSSMCPAIFVDPTGFARLVVGAAGGTKISSAVAQVAMKNLWMNYSLNTAIDLRRIHHQLYPMVLEYEKGYDDEDVVDGLRKIGHVMKEFEIGGSVVNGIQRLPDGRLAASADFRKSSQIDGF